MKTQVVGTITPVHDRLLVVWTVDSKNENKSFLMSLDPDYFVTVAGAVAPMINGESKHHAAVQLRLLRDQAAEMFFAILAASIQSPNSAVFWMLSYRNDELDAIVDGFNNNCDIQTAHGKEKYDWKRIAVELMEGFGSDATLERSKLEQSYDKFLRRLAIQFLDPIVRKEYVSLKHGLRVRPGGMTLTFRPEVSPGVVDTNAAATVLDGSGFGSAFYTAERIDGDKTNYRLIEHHRHWTPRSVELQIKIIVMLIRQVLASLQVRLGYAASVAVPSIADIAVFEECWKTDGSLRDSKWAMNIERSHINAMTREEMLSRLNGSDTLAE